MSIRIPFSLSLKVGGNRLSSAKCAVWPAAPSSVTWKLFAVSLAEREGFRLNTRGVHDTLGVTAADLLAKTVPDEETMETVSVTGEVEAEANR